MPIFQRSQGRRAVVTEEPCAALLARDLVKALRCTRNHHQVAQALSQILVDLMPAPRWENVEDAVARLQVFASIVARLGLVRRLNARPPSILYQAPTFRQA